MDNATHMLLMRKQFARRSGPTERRQNVYPDLDINRLRLFIVFLKDLFH